MTPTAPYSADLGERAPVEAMRAIDRRLRELTDTWAVDDFERSYAPGKWTARQILIHLAQTEVALGYRARMALTTSGYAAQSFDQDAWMAIESAGSGGSGGLSGPVALEALLALVTMNRVLFESLSAADRQAPLSHPEYGSLDVDWIIHQMAGHQIHHLKQLEQIGKP